MALNITAQDVTAYDGLSIKDVAMLARAMEALQAIQLGLNEYMDDTRYRFDIFARMGGLTDTYLLPDYPGERTELNRFFLAGGIETEGDYALYETEGVDDVLNDSEDMREAYERAVEYVEDVVSETVINNKSLAYVLKIDAKIDWLFIGMDNGWGLAGIAYTLVAGMNVAGEETAFTKNYTTDAD